MIDRMGGFHDLSLFNVDLRLPSRFMVEHGLFSTARVRLDAVKGELATLDDRFEIDYRPMPLRRVHMGLEVDAAKGIPTLKDTLEAVTITPCEGIDGNGGPHVDEGPCRAWTLDGGKGGEESVLRQLMGAVSRMDPDVVFTANGDSFAFPFLYYRADRNGLGKVFDLGREPLRRGDAEEAEGDNGLPTPLRTKRKPRSYFSYGRIVYKPAAHLLKGRWHIDASGFHMKESGLEGLMDLARISCMSVQELSRLSPGTAISTMQVHEALVSGYLVAWKKNIPELFKTARDLMAADKGGLILEPVVGVHDQVTEVDFASLYPNIMVRYNISPETILCDCCRPGRNDEDGTWDGTGAGPADVVPEAGYHFCKRREGIVPRVLRPVIARRFEYKRRSKLPDMPERRRAAWREMNDILKWLLVVCFGYTGYKNARFGRIECHESITSYAREIMIHACNIAESLGFQVLHGIVDSLWVKGRGDTDKMCEAISESIGIPILLEGHYRWIVFLPNKGSGVGALNRYYGVFDDGEVKVRGIELRRADTPNYFRRVQEAAVAALAPARDANEFLEHVPGALEVLKGFGEEVLSGGVDPRELVFVNRISQDLSEYRHFSNQVAALKQLKERGFTVRPGQSVRYIITDGGSMDWRERVEVAEFVTEATAYDREKYFEYLCRCGESLLLPFGYALERLMTLLRE
jgi:DNA polymerase elongation subunit (family B)